jgi:hypothetical protein
MPTKYGGLGKYTRTIAATFDSCLVLARLLTRRPSKVLTINRLNFKSCIVQTTRFDYVDLDSLHGQSPQPNELYRKIM